MKIFSSPVSSIPFYPKGTRIPREDIEKYQIFGEYRRAFARGLGGSRKEETWNKEIHICCGSKSYWRHHGNCPRLGNRNDSDDLSDLSDVPVRGAISKKLEN